MCVCVCVCVCKSSREREGEGEDHPSTFHHSFDSLTILQCVGTFEEARASVCLALRRWEGEQVKEEQMEIDGDAVHCGEAEIVRTNDFNAIAITLRAEVEKVEVGIEEVGRGGIGEGGEGRGGREEDTSRRDCRIDLYQINSVKDGSDSSTPPPLSLPLVLSKQSSMPCVLAVLRTHVHLNFPYLKYFHLISAEEILNTYGIEFTIK